jgi:hypothetical protein
MRRSDRREGRASLGNALPLVFLMLIGPSAVLGQELSWTGTASYSTGSYVFDAATHTFYVSNGLQLTFGRVDISGSIPIVAQNSGLVSVVGDVTLPTGGEDHGTVGQRQPGETIGTGKGSGNGSGPGGSMDGGTMADTVTYRDEFTLEVGDPFFSTGIQLYEGSGLLRSVRAQASTKAPLRDLSSGVGTGEWDFGAGGSAFAALGGTYFFVDVAYWWYGDLPDMELVDGLTYGAGVSRSLMDGRGSLMASFLGADAAIQTMDRPASLGLSFGYTPRLGRSYNAGVAFGLSESSPDFSVYAGWTLKVR